MSTIIIILIVVVFIIVPSTPWIILNLGIFTLPSPPKPEITYAEFPFRLVYEIDGEIKVIEDTLICEYDGIGMDTGRGKFRKWDQRLISGNERLVLLRIDDTKEIYYYPGSANYYMDDIKEGRVYVHRFPNADYIEKYENGNFQDSFIASDDLYEKYKIRLISWDYTEPIENHFPDRESKEKQ